MKAMPAGSVDGSPAVSSPTRFVRAQERLWNVRLVPLRSQIRLMTESESAGVAL